MTQSRWLWFLRQFLLWPILIAVACVPSERQANATPSRILVIIMDGARYDVCTARTMPNLYRFMKDGTVFKRAYSPSSWTLPSHASLFTGLYPQQHGAFRLPYQPSTDTKEDARRRAQAKIPVDDVSIPRGLPTLAGELSKAGYQTVGVFGNPCYGYPIFNLGQGFDRWINVVEQKLQATGSRSRGFYSFDYELDGKFYTVIPDAEDVARTTLEVLEAADSSRPLFLFINFEDPIATPLYHPPRERPAILKNYRPHLEQSMRRIDDQLPAILDHFKDGIVIVTADHGQGIGRRFPATHHASSLHPAQTHIPFLCKNLPLGDLTPETPLDLTRVKPMVLEAVGVATSRPNTSPVPWQAGPSEAPCPCAFAHLDASPANPVGRFARFAVYTRDGYLLLDRTGGGLSASLVQRDAVRLTPRQLLDVEQARSKVLEPFLELGRVVPRTGRAEALDETNLEYLRQLGYIE